MLWWALALPAVEAFDLAKPNHSCGSGAQQYGGTIRRRSGGHGAGIAAMIRWPR
jgi:hypothetical protein